MLGLPLVLLGAGGVYLLSRRRSPDVRDNAVKES
jgi:hypothetical protein